MSEVAATGDSLHSDRRAVNQQRREHIAAELKWSADKQLQDFGRSHRSNQASPPVYILVYTELGGEKRFSTSIARRLANTGALNKGDRRANQIGGLEKFNLESKEGRAALKIVYDRVLAGFPIPGLEKPKDALADMGLLAKSESSDEEFVKESEKQNIIRFFNRLLSLEVNRQNALFEYFYKTYTETVEHLKASGKYDLGLEDIRAKSVKIRREPQLIHRDAATGATTHLYELETIVATFPAHFDALEREEAYFYRKLGSEARNSSRRGVLDSHRPGNRLELPNLRGQSPFGRNQFYLDEAELDARYRLVPKSKAKDWWDGEVEKIPDVRQKRRFSVSGALASGLAANQKRQRCVVQNRSHDDRREGVRLVGLQVPKPYVKEITRLSTAPGSRAETSEEIFQSVIGGKESFELVENFRLKNSKVFGDYYVEVVPGRAEHPKKFRAFGITSITQNSRERFLLPQNESKRSVCKNCISFPPIGTNSLTSSKDENRRIDARAAR
jgi:hypothetical protein